MKTSNKILIAFAAALILIPIFGMVYVSRVYYKEGNAKDVVTLNQVDNFSTATPNMTSIPVGNSFQTVEIVDAKNMRLNVVVVKDQKLGIKVPNHLKDHVNLAVAENGKLIITINQKADENERHATFYVYAPKVTELAIAKTGSLSLNISADSLMLTIKNSGHVHFTDNSKFKKLAINASEVERIDIEDNTAEILSLTLNNTDFATQRSSYAALTVKTAGTCELEIRGGDEEVANYSIQNLDINTLGKASVELKHIKVANCAGSFSDETIVNMPAANLNQMFKK